MKKAILSIVLCFIVHFSTSAHQLKNQKVEFRKWQVNGKAIEATFLFHRNDSIFLENKQQALIAFPFKAFEKKDKALLLQKIKYINSLNKQLHHSVSAVKHLAPIKPSQVLGAFILLTLLSIFIILTKHKYKYLWAFMVFIGMFTIFSFTDPAIIRNAFLPFAPNVNTFSDNTYFYVESKGIPSTHQMMLGISNRGWQQQVPIPQCYIGTNAWSIPLNPVMATSPIPVDQSHFTRGAIAIAVNGVPIFNPYTNTGVDAYLDGQLDNYGGHSGRGDDYHYHTAPLHLYNQTSSTLPIAYAFDGFAVYGSLEPDGTNMNALDENHGHLYNSDYHYHGTASAPYMIAKFAGVVTEDATNQLIPQAQAHPVRTENWTPLNGALITSCTSNANNNGYNLSYSLNGTPGYAVNYSWTGTTYTFDYVTPSATNTNTYNGFAQCDVPLYVQEYLEENKFSIYPNPFTESLMISNPNPNAVYTLYNSQGQVIFSGNQIENQHFSNLAKGVYFLQIQNKKGVLKLLKD